ncbi:RNA-binding motif, single-stranded-interacting protein 1 [Merluccius polli]|uniref:RNA-binding motif, single-stranded-interacting protein 1 n=1 Tax=Merluccius polli TaxID=89951 RepID=A0AA47MXT5_MERPO|nr:RNA-binding motif, single-stranded-interacting protein 1 [Merluccius polli]
MYSELCAHSSVLTCVSLNTSLFPRSQSYAPPPVPMAPPSPGTTGLGGGHGGSLAEQLSKTNLYIRGLPPATSDQDLIKLCQPTSTVNEPPGREERASDKRGPIKVSLEVQSVCQAASNILEKSEEVINFQAGRGKSISQSVGQPANHPASQSVRKPASQLVT